MIMKRELYVTNRDDWRAWLEKNHDAAKEVWLICYKKHSGKPGILYEASVEEALCFGWVDSIIRRLDDDRCARKFTPRKGASAWSESNKKRAEKMIRKGRMTKVGMIKIIEAQERGEWSRVREVSKELVVPSFIQKALAKNEKAHAFFRTLADSYKRQIVSWVSSAKKEETKARRLTEVISLLEKSQKLGLK
jgi:uncharacterized protein YdeI (YjbR/CyaY-like superfamily)